MAFVSSNGNQFTVWILPIKGVREENGIYHLEVVAIDELLEFSSSPLNVDPKISQLVWNQSETLLSFLRTKSRFITKPWLGNVLLQNKLQTMYVTEYVLGVLSQYPKYSVALQALLG